MNVGENDFFTDFADGMFPICAQSEVFCFEALDLCAVRPAHRVRVDF